VPTERVAKVVDTTAAGDSFAAGYLAVRLQGGSMADAARHGNRLAGRVIQHRGALIPQDVMTDLVLSK
jgi:2-dehydro-3-deoxygluconokinase